MRTFAALLLLFVALVARGADATDDASLTHRLIGTWVSGPADKGPFAATVTYNTNGTGLGVLQSAGDSTNVEVRVEIQWSITNGILTIKCLRWTDPRLPTGKVLKDRIISISEDKFVYETYEGYSAGATGQRRVRVRKK